MRRKRETIRVINLETGYRTTGSSAVITRGISASLYSGELTCLLGPNGAGKSTLLKTLPAFLPPIKGEIFIEGKPLSSYSAAELSKVVGVVLTERLSLNNMSVEELVGLGRSPYTGFWGQMNSNDREIVAEAISLVGIEHLKDRMIQKLSDGERQKVMIAKALAQETSVIFLDEPTAFLDYPSKVELMQLLQRLAREEGKTVFLSTHDLELALQIADKIWLLDKQHGVTIGTPEDLALNGEMSRYFHREGVLFDRESGIFRISNKMEKHVQLTGSGARYNMVKKALAREGIAAESSLPCAILIEADEGGCTINGHSVDSVAELLERVEELV